MKNPYHWFCVLTCCVLPFTVATVFADAPTTQPTPPAWLSKPTTAWPPILLTNRQMMPNGGVGYSGSSCLARLPNNTVLLMTVKHLLGDVQPTDFAKGFKSWIAVPRPGSSDGVRMKSIAMDPASMAEFDALILLPSAQQTSWPATVLAVREEPLEIGETVYLVGIPEDGKGRQTVRKAEITKRRDDHQLEYAVEGTFKTTGNSGAPVIDSLGRLAAVNASHLDNQTMPGKMQLTCIETAVILPLIKLPATMNTRILSTAKPSSAGDSRHE